ncbi:ABC transporter permease [Paenibacillus terrae]|uniref:ABC transporter permease n=1 Tax=Paenibacillus terrae TaxID=159743 RepID=A0A4U2Q8D7_9BACL|nr:ABC transporter permease [Paenibacillus terrae]TKH46504.1 ABC transporter permease [Paenibacillus terrae]
MKSLRDEWTHLVHSKYPIIAIIFPLIAVLGYSLLLPSSQINEANVVVVDQDNTAYSREFIQKIDASPNMNVAEVVSYTDNPEQYFYHEKFLAVISLPKGLEANHNRSLSSRVGLILDNTNAQSITLIRTAMQEIGVSENMGLSVPAIMKTGMNAEQAQGALNGIALEVRSLFNPTNDYQNTSVLAFTCMFSFMMLNINSLPLIARLRVSRRLAAELQNPFNILLRILPYTLFSTAGLIFSLGVLKMFGGSRFEANPVLFIIPVVLYVFGTVCLNILVAWGAAHPGVAIGRMVIVLMPAFVLSGAVLSRSLFPSLAIQIGDFFPFAWLYKFVRSMGLRGAPLQEMLPELGSMLLYVGVLSMLVIARALWEKQKLAKNATGDAPGMGAAHSAAPSMPGSGISAQGGASAPIHKPIKG